MKLFKIMQERNLSQRRLAEMANITSQDLNQALKNKKPFFPAWRKRIATVLQMQENEVFPEYYHPKGV